MHRVRHIFRAYDIRGVVGKDFDEHWVENLGKALGCYFLRQGHDSAVLGSDCRPSSPLFLHMMAKGLSCMGVHVINVGMVPTPALYFAVKHLHKSAGVMITASHNPPEYNGFKIWCGATTLYGEAIQDVRRLLEEGLQKGFCAPVQGKIGLVCEHQILPSYIEAIVSRHKVHRPLKVVVDGGNGVGGPTLVDVLRRMGASVTELFCDIDGTFPNHHPDPTVEANVQALIHTVRETGADLGIGLDGDADRLGVVDAKGRLLNGDELLGIYASDLLERQPGALVLGDVKCSDRLFTQIEQCGGQARMCVTGHSVVKAKMQELNAPLAGELSGHMFFGENWYGFDDAIYGSARLLDILSRLCNSLTDLPGWPVAFSTREVQIPCPDEHKFAVVAKAQEHYKKLYPVVDMDGARVRFAHGWGLVRASNTQPVLVLRFEAHSADELTQIKNEMESRITGWITACTDVHDSGK